MNSEGIKVRIFDLDKGLTEYEHIQYVRIVCPEYNLLIMQDYLPIIGEIDGNVDIILSNIVSFLVVAIIILIAIAIIFRVTLKKYNVKSNKLKFYGLFLEMDNSSIVAFS